MAWTFRTPPTWPQPPEGWIPPEGWVPDPAWGPAPQGWVFWVDDGAQGTPTVPPPPDPPVLPARADLPEAGTVPPPAELPGTAAAPPAAYPPSAYPPSAYPQGTAPGPVPTGRHWTPGAVVLLVLAGLFGLRAVLSILQALTAVADRPLWAAARMVGSLLIPALCLAGALALRARSDRTR